MRAFGGATRPHFSLGEAMEFKASHFVRKRLFETSDMHFNVYCIAPGQENPPHRHPSSDEILYFVEGAGECLVGRESYGVKAGDLVFVPKNTPHAIRNTHAILNLVCVLAQAPLPCEHVPVRPETAEQGQ